ncbi:MAG TPA: hypothetical protein VIH59_35760 [Candidatus Tectomicrobia bacterium]|jgi:hypothetical protein
MLQTPEEAILPATSEPAPLHPLRQDGAVGSREAYYAYHLGREVQQYHQRLFDKQRLDVASNQHYVMYRSNGNAEGSNGVASHQHLVYRGTAEDGPPSTHS